MGPKLHTALLSRCSLLANWHKAKAKLARLHARIVNIRRDALHELTTSLTRCFHTIAIEDLNVRGMVKHRYLARSIADMGFYEFRQQLQYKAVMRSKTCCRSALGL